MNSFSSSNNKRGNGRNNNNNNNGRKYKKTSPMQILKGTEFKAVYDLGTGDEMLDSGTITPLNIIGQGDTSQQRSGRRVRITKVTFKCMIKINQGTALTIPNQNWRVMLVLNRQSNGATFTLADLLQDPSAGDSIVSPYNLASANRFHMYFDRSGWVSSSVTSRHIDFTFYPNFDVLYSGTGSGIADIVTNSLSLLYLSDIASGSNGPDITWHSVTRFIDL